MPSKKRLSAALLCVMALAACGEDGSAPYAGWTTVTGGDGVYRLRFLEPPWERTQSMSGDAGIALVVQPAFGSLDAGAPSKYSLEAKLVPGVALTVLDAEVARLRGARVLVHVAHAPFVTLPSHDDAGFTAVLEDTARTRFTRLVALAAPGSRTLLVRVDLNLDPRNDRELDAMLAAIDVLPFATDE